MAKLSLNSVIPSAKLSNYLLIRLPKDDKSQFLDRGGYSIENWQQLDRDLRSQILSLEAEQMENTRYGEKYMIKGSLTSPNGTILQVKTVWMVTPSETRFVTLVPD
jgi:outer membrane receptor for Fe3+-dicitrate